TGKKVDKVITDLSQLKLTPVVIGNGKNVNATMPGANAKLIENEKVLIITDGEMVIPDMTGWSKLDVMKFIQASGIDFIIEGNGFVISQNIAPNSIITEESKLEIQLQPPLD